MNREKFFTKDYKSRVFTLPKVTMEYLIKPPGPDNVYPYRVGVFLLNYDNPYILHMYIRDWKGRFSRSCDFSDNHTQLDKVCACAKFIPDIELTTHGTSWYHDNRDSNYLARYLTKYMFELHLATIQKRYPDATVESLFTIIDTAGTIELPITGE